MAFERELTAFLESGCALIVGVVSHEGEPYATRGWGLTVIAGEPASIRLLLDADDATAITNLSTTGAIAVTATHVPTLRATQLKGQCVRVEDGTDHDRERAARYVELFFADIAETERTPSRLLDRLPPADFVAGVVEVEEWFDQTPGPTAGAPIVVPTP